MTMSVTSACQGPDLINQSKMMSELHAGVEPNELSFAHTKGPFDQAQKALEERGFRVASLYETADLRVRLGKDFLICQEPSYVKEGVIHIPKRGSFLVRESPILFLAAEATEAHRQRQQF